MSKKILFMSSAKLTAISIGLLLAVFCTIGMSFRPVYDEQEAEEIVMSGPRRSHWTTSGTEGSGCNTTDVTYYNDKKDYAKTIAQSLNSAYGTVAITANSKNATPVTAADGSQSYVEWDSGVTEHEPSDKNKTENTGLDDAHTNTITFTATPTDPDEYRFVGWYSDAGGTSLVSAEGEATWEKEVKFATAAGITSYNSGSAVTTYESTSSRWTVTYYAKFEKIPSTNVTFLAASTSAKDNGSYTVVGKGVNSTITTSNQVIPVKSITLTATPSEATEFLNWYKLGAGDEKIILSTENPFTTSFTEETTVGVEWRELEKNLTIVFKAVEKDESGVRKGSYTIDGVTVSATDYEHFTGETYKYKPTLVATPATGYSFKGWYVKEAGVKRYLSTDATWTPTITEELTIYADFVFTAYPAESLAQFKVGSAYYDDLNAANTAAHSGSNKVIICSRDGYLLPGSYTISSDVTLLIPYSTSETLQTAPEKIVDPKSMRAASAYRTLTVLDGADIDCYGKICVAGQIVSDEGNYASGYPAGNCGVINMANGGHIELKSGATLYAWGFIKGQDIDQGNNTTGVGTITANSGSTVWEDISFGDWRGGSAALAAAENTSYRYFPFQSYSIQNIEVPLSLKYGAEEKVRTALYMPSTESSQEPTPTLIAKNDALFLLKDSKSLVRKWYDPTTDLVCYELSGTAQLYQLSVTVSMSIISKNIQSASFDLPICGNMHVIFADCDMTLSYPIIIQAGAVVEVKKGANVTIASNVHLFDQDEWDLFVIKKYFQPFNSLSSHEYRGDGSSKNNLDDAKMIVDGNVTVTGAIYSSTGGANIMGNGGGKITFSSSLPANKYIYMMWNGGSGDKTGTKIEYNYVVGTATAYLHSYPFAAANLCNEDGTYTKSAKNTFYNVNGRWFVEGKQNERTSAGLEHTYEFTYMASGNSGDNVNTPAVYSHDRTGLEPRMKWFNVNTDACANWWVDGSSRLYNWTKFSDWHQFIPTEITDVYGCSNGELYTKVSCTQWDPLGGTDENCLYTIGGVKKALVGTSFIEMEPNTDDAAFHKKGAATEYYISFDGCIWHSATRIDDEKKAYTVEEQQFIWFEGGWLNVEREAPFFYSLDELNVKTYYEYIGSEWVIAEPYVRVTTDDPTQTRALLTLHEAVAVASQYKNPTITILRDLKGFATPFSYTAANTTCTLNLNGHKAELTVRESGTTAIKMFTINASGSTFTITDTSEGEKGELKLIASVNTATSTQRWSGIYLQNGSLILQKGKISIDHPFTWVSNSNTGLIQGILVASGKSFTMNGGKVYVEADYNPYGICGASGTPTITVNGGTIETVARTKDSPYSIIGYGTINVKGTGEVRAIALKSSSSRGVSVSASSSYQGTLNVTGGTIYSEATSSAQGVNCGGTVVVTGDYNATTPNNTPKSRHYAKANISGGTITAVCSTGATCYGVLSYGTTVISGGIITSTVKTSSKTDARGVCVLGGTTTIKTGANITANAPATAYGAFCSGANGDSNRGWPHVGVLNVEGGTITANTTNTTTAYGLYVTGATWTINRTNSYKVFNGDYASAGTATVTGGYFYANAKTSTAMGIGVANTVTKNDASATPVCTINGGYFKMTGTGSLTGANTAALPANFHVNGGYYSHDGNLEGYAVSPKHVISLPQADPNRPNYNYKVAEAYTITFKSEDGETTLQSSYQEKGTTPEYNGEPQTKPSSTTTSYVFDGWSSSVGGSLVSPLPSVTSSGGTYYAHFNETTLKYMVTLDAKTNGGNEEAQVIYVEPSAAVGTLPTATKTGYTQTGWYTAASGGTKLETTTSITADGTYYAQFSINSHTLTWNLAGGTVKTAGTGAAASATGSPSSSVNYNATITAPVVTKAGYTFANWGVPTVAAKMPDNDLAYTAVWTPATNTAYKVYHYQQNVDDDAYTLFETQSLTGTTGESVTPVVKSYDGFIKPEPQSLTIGAAGTSSLTYNYDRVVYTIKWNAYANGGTCTAPNTTVRHGKTLGTMPVAIGSTSSLAFGGWYTKAEGGTKITEETPIMQNYGVLYAHFVPTYVITWKNADGTEITTTNVPYDAIPEYTGETPTRESDENYAYTFDGHWSAIPDGDILDPLPAVIGPATYYAHYSTTPTVASVTVGGVTTYYTDFAEAWEATNSATGTVTLKLLQDVSGVTTSLAYTNAQNCTLDLNNHTILGSVSDRLLEINAAGKTFTIDDSSAEKGGRLENSKAGKARYYAVYLSAGILNLEHGTIHSSNPSDATYSTLTSNAKKCIATGVYVAASQTFNMNGGEVSASAIYLPIGIQSDGYVNVNGGLVAATATKFSTAYGIYAGSTTKIYDGATITAISTNSTSTYGIYIAAGTTTLYGGKIESYATSASGTTAIGVYAYKGNLSVPESSTVDVIAKSYGKTCYGVQVAASRTATIKAGSYAATSTNASTASGVYSLGNTTISGGTFTISTKTTNAYGVYATRGKITVNGSPIFNVTAGSTTAYGAFAYGTVGANGKSKYSGTIEINGGTFNVTTTTTTAYGAYAGLYSRTVNLVIPENAADTIAGQHYMPGIISVTNGTFNVKAKTTAAYGIVVAAAKSESGTVGTTARRPTATITGGNFKVESEGDDNATAYAMNTSATATYLKVQGGKYSTKRTNASETSNIEDKYTAPTKSCNYHVLPLTGEDPYKYEVAEACTITFKNGETTMQEGPVKKGATPAYSGATPTKAEDESYTYTFDGWSTTDGGDKLASLPAVSADATYFAHYSKTEKKYTVNVSAGEHGSVSPASVSGIGCVTASGDITATPNTGYRLDNWTLPTGVTAADGYTSESNPIHIHATASGKTITANFAAKTYTVTLDNQSATTPGAASVTATYNEAMPSIAANLPAKTGYAFGGYFSETNGGGTQYYNADGTSAHIWDVDAASPTLYAKWTSAETGFWLDIVDVDNSAKTLTLNVTRWAASGWPYTINNVPYGKNSTAGQPQYRLDNRTLVLSYDDDGNDPGDDFTITVKNKTDVLYSLHSYIIPTEVKTDVELSDLTTKQKQIIYVKNGATLTVDANATVKNIYMAPGAKLVIGTGITLTADTVFLRTTPEAAAELENAGNISAQVCYTRIISDMSQYYQFGLPVDCNLSDVRLSDGMSIAYGNNGGAWILRSYSERGRAENGAGENWNILTGDKILGGVGYEMYSAYSFYREFYFPVSLASITNKVPVTHTVIEGKDEKQAGWNVLVSPLTQAYTNNPEPEDITISWLQADGFSEQMIPTTIYPARAFAYQAVQDGNLWFTDATMSASAPRRRVTAAEEPTRIQWIHLDIASADGKGDQTSIYSHPTRYEQAYKTGIDVEKQSLSASRAILYSSHAYGDMAFAGVADTLLESGVALTVYSPVAQELTFSLRDNEWLNRMESVWLIDKEEGMRIDLLNGYYTFNASEGTTRGRFFIQGQFKAPQVATDIQNGQSGEVQTTKARKLMINQKIFIEINGRLYDATGKEVKR